MQLHNAMEDIVTKQLNDIIKTKESICKCEQCLLDMACYALNKIRPMYMVSSRGVIHTEIKKHIDIQDDIDVISIVNEAIHVVSRTKRHSIDQTNLPFENELKSNIQDKYCYFNFPQIVGRVFNGNNLEPMSDVFVTLNSDTGSDIVTMFNSQWNNPISIVDQMNGTFAFWPVPEKCERSGIQRDFQFNINISKNGFEQLVRTFKLTVLSISEVRNYIEKAHTFYLEDVFLTKETFEDEE